MPKKKLLLGLLGYPIAHSLSPVLHEHLLAENGLCGSYHAFEVGPENLGSAVAGIRALGINGVNVTVPHKQSIIPYLDSVGERAASVNAINTVRVQDERLVGENTDVLGFKFALQRNDVNPRGKVSVVLGAGGAARAVIWTLVSEKISKIYLFNRRTQGAKDLAEDISSKTGFEHFVVGELSDQRIAEALDAADLVVNATPVGMWPRVDATPFRFVSTTRNLTTIDLVYNPVQTAFLKSAQEVGVKTIDGLDMFICQAFESLKLWLAKKHALHLDFDRTKQFLLETMVGE